MHNHKYRCNISLLRDLSRNMSHFYSGQEYVRITLHSEIFYFSSNALRHSMNMYMGYLLLWMSEKKQIIHLQVVALRSRLDGNAIILNARLRGIYQFSHVVDCCINPFLIKTDRCAIQLQYTWLFWCDVW